MGPPAPSVRGPEVLQGWQNQGEKGDSRHMLEVELTRPGDLLNLRWGDGEGGGGGVMVALTLGPGGWGLLSLLQKPWNRAGVGA